MLTILSGLNTLLIALKLLRFLIPGILCMSVLGIRWVDSLTVHQIKIIEYLPLTRHVVDVYITGESSFNLSEARVH